MPSQTASQFLGAVTFLVSLTVLVAFGVDVAAALLSSGFSFSYSILRGVLSSLALAYRIFGLVGPVNSAACILVSRLAFDGMTLALLDITKL